MALIFLYAVVVAPVAEANFWAERRKAAQTAERSPDAGTQVAGLPKTLSEISRSLPTITRSIPAPLAAPARDAERADISRLPRWLTSLPSAFGDVRRIRLSTRPNAPLVLLVQDIHEVHSAQENVSRLLGHLQDGLGSTLLVGLEGASGAFGLAPYRAFRDTPRHQGIADYLLRNGFISGAEHFGLLAEREPRLWGVEDPALYLANINAYRDGLLEKSAALSRLARLEGTLAPLKAKAYTPALSGLEASLAAYQRGESGVLVHVKLLAAAAPRRPASVENFLQAAAMEESLDFQRVERERLELVQRLTQSLSEAELDGLLRQSLAYRLGRIGYGGYYAYLRDLAEGNDVRLADYPAFDRYVRYVLLAEKIDSAQLFRDVEALRAAVVAKLASTPAQRRLWSASEDLRLLERLARNEFGPEEWAAFAARRAELLDIESRVSALSGAAAERGLASALPRFEEFYRVAEKRNGALTRNLLARAAQDKSRAAVLIAGGFHTPGLERLLAEGGASVVTLTPKVGKVEDGTKYLDVFAMERTPLERTLLGDRLFLSPPSAMAVSPTPGFESAGEMPRRAYGVMEVALGGLQEQVQKWFGLDIEVDGITHQAGVTEIKFTVADGAVFSFVFAERKEGRPFDQRLAPVLRGRAVMEQDFVEAADGRTYDFAMVAVQGEDGFGVAGNVAALLADKVRGVAVSAAQAVKAATKPSNPHEVVIEQVRSVAPYVPALADGDVFKRLTNPDRHFAGSFDLRLDNDDVETVQYGRFQHNLNAGPAKGGIRFAETVTKEEEIALALWMTYKNALIGNPYGGGKGGIRFAKSPRQYSSAELERASRSYVRNLLKDDPNAVGPRTDVPAPDMNTSPREMAWMMDEFIRFHLERGTIQDDGMRKSLLARFGIAEDASAEDVAAGLVSLYEGKDSALNPVYEAYLETWNDQPSIVPFELAFITGKPVEVTTKSGRKVKAGGSLGRTAATGLGVTFIAEKSVEAFLKKPFRGTTFVVQGFGNVGSYAALEIWKRGGVVTAISDFDGSGVVHNPDGINVGELFAHFERRKNDWEALKAKLEKAGADLKKELPARSYFDGFELMDPGTKLTPWGQRDILTDFEADVLVPAAVGSVRLPDGSEKNVINGENAGQLKFKVIVEGANGPTSPEADEILKQRGVVAVPDFLANAGGVRVSYYEWAQNIANERWTEADVNAKLEDSMKSAFDMVYLVSRDKGVTMRQAAYIVSINKVLGDMKGRAPPSKPANPHEAVISQVRSVAPYIPILQDPSIFERLTQPERDIHGSFDLRLDNDDVETVQYGRFQHNLNAGPAKGGIRFAETVTKEEEIALALWMTYKNALIGNPYGGGKGGIRFAKSPRQYSSAELERASRLYIRNLLKDDPNTVGPRTDVPAPDMNTSPREMAWMMDEFIRFHLERGTIEDPAMQDALRARFGIRPQDTPGEVHIRLSQLDAIHRKDGAVNWVYEAYLEIWNDNAGINPFELAFITGKPVEVKTASGRKVKAGGSLGRTAATGLGVTFIAEKSVEAFLKKPFKGTTFVVQGFGNVGSYAALEIWKRGGVVTAVSDFSGGIASNPNGLNVGELFAYFERQKKDWETLKAKLEKSGADWKKEMPEQRFFGGFELLDPGTVVTPWGEQNILTDFEADVLVPAAIGSERLPDGTEKNVINGENAGQLKFKVIVEGANGPTSPEADEILKQRGVVAVPDFLANAGGVRVSYYEWEQNMTNQRWTEDEVNAKLEKSMKTAFDKVYAVYADKGVTMRQAAYIVSIKKVLFDMLGRGPPKGDSSLGRIAAAIAVATFASLAAAPAALAQGNAPAASAGAPWDTIITVALIVLGLGILLWRKGPAWLSSISGALRDRFGSKTMDDVRGMTEDEVRQGMGYPAAAVSKPAVADAPVSPAISEDDPDAGYSVSAEGVGAITLKSEKGLNALTFVQVQKLLSLVESARADARVKVLVFRGEKGNFSVGADIVEILKNRLNPETTAKGAEFLALEARLHEAIHAFPKPTVTLATGYTIGGGLGIAAATKFIVTDDTTKISMPEVKIGLFPDVGATWFLPQRMGLAAGKYFGLTGDFMDGREAVGFGLAHGYAGADVSGFLRGLTEAAERGAVSERDIAALLPDGTKADLAQVVADKLARIEKYFNFGRRNKGYLGDIYSALEEGSRAGDEFAQKALTAMRSGSAQSLWLTEFLTDTFAEKAYDRRKAREIELAFSQEVTASQAFMEGVLGFKLGLTKAPHLDQVVLTDAEGFRFVAAGRPTQTGSFVDAPTVVPYKGVDYQLPGGAIHPGQRTVALSSADGKTLELRVALRNSQWTDQRVADELGVIRSMMETHIGWRLVRRAFLTNPEKFELDMIYPYAWIERPSVSLDMSEHPANVRFPDGKINPARAIFDQARAKGVLDTRWVDNIGEAQEDGKNVDVRRFTYADIEKEANRMANVLKHRYGVKPGDQVLIYQSTAIEGMISQLAAILAGASYHFLYSAKGADLLSDSIHDMGAKVIITEDGYRIGGGKSKQLKKDSVDVVLSRYMPKEEFERRLERGLKKAPAGAEQEIGILREAVAKRLESKTTYSRDAMKELLKTTYDEHQKQTILAQLTDEQRGRLKAELQAYQKQLEHEKKLAAKRLQDRATFEKYKGVIVNALAATGNGGFSVDEEFTAEQYRFVLERWKQVKRAAGSEIPSGERRWIEDYLTRMVEAGGQSSAELEDQELLFIVDFAKRVGVDVQQLDTVGRLQKAIEAVTEAIEKPYPRDEQLIVFERLKKDGLSEATLVEGRDTAWDRAIQETRELLAKDGRNIDEFDAHAWNSSDGAFFVASSGSTGKPKLIVRTIGATVFGGQTMRNAFGLAEHETHHTSTDYGWIVGPSYALWNPLLESRSFTLQSFTPTPARLLQVVQEYRHSYLKAGSPVLDLISRFPDIRKFDVSSLIREGASSIYGCAAPYTFPTHARIRALWGDVADNGVWASEDGYTQYATFKRRPSVEKASVEKYGEVLAALGLSGEQVVAGVRTPIEIDQKIPDMLPFPWTNPQVVEKLFDAEDKPNPSPKVLDKTISQDKNAIGELVYVNPDANRMTFVAKSREGVRGPIERDDKLTEKKYFGHDAKFPMPGRGEEPMTAYSGGDSAYWVRFFEEHPFFGRMGDASDPVTPKTLYASGRSGNIAKVNGHLVNETLYESALSDHTKLFDKIGVTFIDHPEREKTPVIVISLQPDVNPEGLMKGKLIDTVLEAIDKQITPQVVPFAHDIIFLPKQVEGLTVAETYLPFTRTNKIMYDMIKFFADPSKSIEQLKRMQAVLQVPDVRQQVRDGRFDVFASAVDGEGRQLFKGMPNLEGLGVPGTVLNLLDQTIAVREGDRVIEPKYDPSSPEAPALRDVPEALLKRLGSAPLRPGIDPVPPFQEAWGLVRNRQGLNMAHRDPAIGFRKMIRETPTTKGGKVLVQILYAGSTYNSINGITNDPVDIMGAKMQHVFGDAAVAQVLELSPEAEQEGRLAVGQLVIVDPMIFNRDAHSNTDTVQKAGQIGGYQLGGDEATYQAFAAYHPVSLLEVPVNMELPMAANLLLNGPTPEHALFNKTKLDVAAGDVVLVQGVSGQTGGMAINMLASIPGVKILGYVMSEAEKEKVLADNPHLRGRIEFLVWGNFKDAVKPAPVGDLEELRKWQQAVDRMVKHVESLGNGRGEYRPTKVMQFAGTPMQAVDMRLLRPSKQGSRTSWFSGAFGLYGTLNPYDARVPAKELFGPDGVNLKLGRNVLVHYGANAEDRDGEQKVFDPVALDAILEAGRSGANVAVLAETRAQMRWLTALVTKPEGELIALLGEEAARWLKKSFKVNQMRNVEDLVKGEGGKEKRLIWPEHMPDPDEGRGIFDKTRSREAHESWPGKRNYEKFATDTASVVKDAFKAFSTNPSQLWDVIWDSGKRDHLAANIMLLETQTGHVVYGETVSSQVLTYHIAQGWMVQRSIIVPANPAELEPNATTREKLIRMNGSHMYEPGEALRFLENIDTGYYKFPAPRTYDHSEIGQALADQLSGKAVGPKAFRMAGDLDKVDSERELMVIEGTKIAWEGELVRLLLNEAAPGRYVATVEFKRNAVKARNRDRNTDIHTFLLNTVKELTHSLEKVRQDGSIRSVVITADSTRALLAGQDIKILAKMSETQIAELAAASQEAFAEMEDFDRPIVVHLAGLALGGGSELVSAAHYVVASDIKRVFMGQPESSLNLIPGFGGTQRFVRIMADKQGRDGVLFATDSVMTGQPITAAEAARYGLISELVPSNSLARAYELAFEQATWDPADRARVPVLQKAMEERRAAAEKWTSPWIDPETGEPLDPKSLTEDEYIRGYFDQARDVGERDEVYGVILQLVIDNLTKGVQYGQEAFYFGSIGSGAKSKASIRRFLNKAELPRPVRRPKTGLQALAEKVLQLEAVRATVDRAVAAAKSALGLAAGDADAPAAGDAAARPVVERPVKPSLARLRIDPGTDAVLVVDPQGTFMAAHEYLTRQFTSGGLGIPDGHGIIPYSAALLDLFPQNNRFASQDWHPDGHISLASSFDKDFVESITAAPGKPPYLTYDHVKDWTDRDNRLSPRASFDVAQMKEYLQLVGGQVLWPDHGIQGTAEAEIHPALRDLFAYVQKKGMDPAKDSYSAFFDNGGRSEDATGLLEEMKRRVPGLKRVFITGLAYDFCVGWSAQDAAEKLGLEVVIVKDATRAVDIPPAVGYAGSVAAANKFLVEAGVWVVDETKKILEANGVSTEIGGAFHQGTIAQLIRLFGRLAGLPGVPALPKGSPTEVRIEEARQALGTLRRGEVPQADVLQRILARALKDAAQFGEGAGTQIFRRAAREVVLAATHLISNTFVSKLTAEEASRIRLVVESFSFAKLAEAFPPVSVPLPELDIFPNVQSKRVSDDGRSLVLSLRTKKGVVEVRVQAAKDMPFGTLYADDGTHIGATWRGPTRHGIFSLPGLALFAPPAYTVTLQPETLQNPALLYQALLEDLNEIKFVAEGGRAAEAHETFHGPATSRGLAYDLSRQLTYRGGRPLADENLVPSVGKQLAAEFENGRLAQTAERLNNNLSYLGMLSALTGQGYGFLGFGAEMSDAAEFHGFLTDASARKVELTKGDAAAFRALVDAVARTAQEVSAAYEESPDIARKRYGYFAARSALAAGAAGQSSGSYGDLAKNLLTRDYLALRELLSGQDASAEQQSAFGAIADLGGRLALNDASLDDKTASLNLADLRGAMIENADYVGLVAQGIGRPAREDGASDVTVIITDLESPRALRLRLEALEKTAAAESGSGALAVRKILDNWDALVVLTSKDLREREGVLRQGGAVDVARLLEAPELESRVSLNHAIRILTADPSLWWTQGLPESRQALVEFLLWVTKDVFFKARKGDIEEYLKAVQVLNIQA